jgi:hypothetical protein
MATYYKPPQLDFGGSGKSQSYQPNPFLGSGASTGIPTAAAPAPAPLPDFGQILASDPFYQAALGNLTAQGITDKKSRDTALQSAYTRFGEAPIDPRFLPEELRAEMASILSPDIKALAKNNDTAGLSILARLKDAAQQTAKRTTDVLGSRGLFRSGETGYQFGRNQLYASQANYDATNKFLDYIMGVQAAYIQAERQRQALLKAEAEAAAGRVVPPVTPPAPPVTPHPNPNGQPTHGTVGPQSGHAPPGPGQYQPNPYVTPEVFDPNPVYKPYLPYQDEIKKAFGGTTTRPA